MTPTDGAAWVAFGVIALLVLALVALAAEYWVERDGREPDARKKVREMSTKRHVGYDGTRYDTGDRVEIHPGTDLWMQGARYGTVVGSSLTPDDRVHVEMDALPSRKFSGSEDTFRLI